MLFQVDESNNFCFQKFLLSYCINFVRHFSDGFDCFNGNFNGNFRIRTAFSQFTYPMFN